MVINMMYTYSCVRICKYTGICKYMHIYAHKRCFLCVHLKSTDNFAAFPHNKNKIKIKKENVFLLSSQKNTGKKKQTFAQLQMLD